MSRLLHALKRIVGPTPEDWMLDLFMLAAIVLIVVGSYRCWLHAR